MAKSEKQTQQDKVVAPSPLKKYLLCGLLFVAILAAYSRVFHCGFIWDDDDYVIHNQTLRDAQGLEKIWCEPLATPQYYPVVHTTFWIEYHLWKLNPAGYHADNVLLHALGGLLLWRILLRLRLPFAWLAAALFMLHPVQVESVAWVTERKNVLSAVFYFMAALAYLNFTGIEPEQKSRSWAWYFIAMLFFVAALLSKSVTCSLPAALLLVYWWKGRLDRKGVLLLVPFFVVGAGMAWTTSWLEKSHVGASGWEWSLTFADRLLIAGRAVWFYAGKLLWPVNLAFQYPRWDIDPSIWWQWLFPVGAAGVVGGLWLARKKIGRGPLVAVLFFGGTLLPALGFINIYPMRYSFVADHFQYLGCIGLFVLAATVLGRLPKVIPVVMILALGVLTWFQTAGYKDLPTLWTATIAHNPDAFLAHNNLGALLQKDGKMDEAVAHFRTALKIRPEFPEANCNYGRALFQMGQVDEGMAYLEKSLQLQPFSSVAHEYYADALQQKGRTNEAMEHFQEAVKFKPANATAHDHLAHLFLDLHRTDDAIQEFQTVLQLQPDDAKVFSNLGNVYLSVGRVPEAIVAFEKALEIRPDLVMTCYNLATAQYLSGQYGEGVRHWEQTIQLDPKNLRAYGCLAWALATCPDASVRNGNQAIELIMKLVNAGGKNDPTVLRILAAAYAEAGNYDDALTTAQRAMQIAGDHHITVLVNELGAEMAVYQAKTPFHEATGKLP